MFRSKLDNLLRILEKVTIIPAYIIVVAWGVREVINSNYDTAALAIPLVLALAVLVDLRKQVLSELPTRRVSNFGETHSFIKEALARQVKKRNAVEIRILGQTMQSYLAFLKPVLLETATRTRELRMTIRIAMIDPVMAHLGPGLHDAANAAIGELKALAQELRSIQQTVAVELFLYNSPPAITGIAVNDSCLFLGMIRYERKSGSSTSYEMATTAGSPVADAKTVTYEMVRAAGGSFDIYRDSKPEDEERINLFLNSFDALCLRSTKIL
jgi:hypothetical protein